MGRNMKLGQINRRTFRRPLNKRGEVNIKLPVNIMELEIMRRRFVALPVFFRHGVEIVKVIITLGICTLMYIEVLTFLLQFKGFAAMRTEEEQVFKIAVFLVESALANLAQVLAFTAGIVVKVIMSSAAPGAYH
jgi:hypothetical protein